MSHSNNIYRYLDTNGDGTGTKSAIGNYSSSATSFMIKPPDNYIYYLQRMIVMIEDGGAVDSGAYGNNITLTNGIHIHKSNDDGVILDFTDEFPIKTNADWGKLCYDVHNVNFGLGNEFVNVRWTFAKSGAPLKIDGNRGEKFEVILNDNFSGLVSHTFNVQGTILYVDKL